MACNCIKLANKELAASNTHIVTHFRFNFAAKTVKASGAVIQTAKINSKKRAPAVTLFASFCPICGKRYEKLVPKTSRKTKTEKSRA